VKVKLTLEYDGSDFRGWARQPGLRTVEGAVRTALDETFTNWGELSVAGRTDTGVHATGQVASVSVEGGPPAGATADALNAALPADVAVVDASEASDEFDARFSAVARTYRYRVLLRRARSPLEEGRALHWKRGVDVTALETATSLLVGEHDFRAFTPTETQHEVFVRNVESAAWERSSDRLELTITADSFLRHMVRTLVGTMLEAGSDAPDRLEPLLAGRPRSEAGLTAPPGGLYLEQVRY
jgi:tRNA pseudouridine38-40 synthase